MPGLSTSHNVPAKLPDWAIHRRAVAAADTIPITTSTLSAGVQASEYMYGHARARLASGSLTSLKLRPLFWDDVLADWVADPDIAEKDLGTAAGVITFENRGRIFFIAVHTLTGTNPKIDIDVAVF